MTEYEFRLVTQVTRGEEGSGFMGNMVLDYVVLGSWVDNDIDTSGTSNELPLEVMNQDLAREAMLKVNTRHIKVDIPAGFGTVLNVRSSRTDETADNIIGQLTNGTELDVMILNDSDVWVQIQYEGGYSEYTGEKTGSPKDLKLYEFVEGNYILSLDNEFANDKTYYSYAEGVTGYIMIRINGTPVVKEIEQTAKISYYELLMTEPSDWSSAYTSYFTRNMDGSYSPVESGEAAPPWKANKYYRHIENQQTDGRITTGALVKVKQSAENYYNLDIPIPQSVKDTNWYVMCLTSPERVVIDASENGSRHIESPIHIKDLELVREAGKPAEPTTDENTDTETETEEGG